MKLINDKGTSINCDWGFNFYFAELASRYKERRIKVVKVPGSYGKYEIKDVWLDETDKEILGVIILFAVLAIIF